MGTDPTLHFSAKGLVSWEGKPLSSCSGPQNLDTAVSCKLLPQHTDATGMQCPTPGLGIHEDISGALRQPSHLYLFSKYLNADLR